MERVADLMSKGAIYTASPQDTVLAAARKMKASAKGCLVVTAGGKPVGILTERDIVHKVVAAGGRDGTKVFEVMSSPVITIGPQASAADAARVMSRNKIRRLVVAEDGRALGVLTVTDFARRLEHSGSRGTSSRS